MSKRIRKKGRSIRAYLEHVRGWSHAKPVLKSVRTAGHKGDLQPVCHLLSLFPVRGSKLIRHLRDDVLVTYLADTVKALHMRPDGTYLRTTNRSVEEATNSQQSLIDRVVTRSGR